MNRNGIWIPDVTVRLMLAGNPFLLTDSWQVLISSLDSEHEIREMRSIDELIISDRLKPLCDSPFVLTGSDVEILASDRNFFTGFDELWFFSDAAPKAPPPTSIVAPTRVDQAVDEVLLGWIAKTNCSFGAGDGDGLNVVLGEINETELRL